MIASVLTYGSEQWTLREQGRRRIKAAEIQFLSTTKESSLRDQIGNEDIRAELEGTYQQNGRR